MKVQIASQGGVWMSTNNSIWNTPIWTGQPDFFHQKQLSWSNWSVYKKFHEVSLKRDGWSSAAHFQYDHSKWMFKMLLAAIAVTSWINFPYFFQGVLSSCRHTFGRFLGACEFGQPLEMAELPRSTWGPFYWVPKNPDPHQVWLELGGFQCRPRECKAFNRKSIGRPTTRCLVSSAPP